MKPGEIQKVALAFAAFFFLLFGYYILRPVRDKMGVQTGVEKLQWLFTAVPCIVFVSLALVGSLWRVPFLAVVQVIHRAGDYSLMRPGREMIFTTVDPESRYKAKNFIDTTVYRANDAAASWIVSALRAGGLSTIYFAALPAAALWFFTGYRLGGRHDRINGHDRNNGNDSHDKT